MSEEKPPFAVQSTSFIFVGLISVAVGFIAAAIIVGVFGILVGLAISAFPAVMKGPFGTVVFLVLAVAALFVWFWATRWYFRRSYTTVEATLDEYIARAEKKFKMQVKASRNRGTAATEPTFNEDAAEIDPGIDQPSPTHSATKEREKVLQDDLDSGVAMKPVTHFGRHVQFNQESVMELNAKSTHSLLSLYVEGKLASVDAALVKEELDRRRLSDDEQQQIRESSERVYMIPPASSEPEPMHSQANSPDETSISEILSGSVGRILGGALGLTLLMYLLQGVFGGGIHSDFFTIKGFLLLYAIGLVAMVVREVSAFGDGDSG